MKEVPSNGPQEKWEKAVGQVVVGKEVKMGGHLLECS